MSTEDVLVPENSLFRIEQSTHPPGLRLYGSLDGEARSILERELDQAITDGRDLRVDMSDLDFISVGCMQTLMDAAVYLHLDGCRLVLLGPNLAVRLTIAICQETAQPGNVEVLPCPA